MDMESNDEKLIRARLDSLRTRGDEDDLTWRLAQVREKLRSRSLPMTPRATRKTLLSEADSLVESILRDTKNHPTAMLFKGQILEAEENWDKAVEYYSRAWARGAPAALSRWIDLLARLGRTDDLIRLRQSDTTNQIDQLEALTFLRHGNRSEASKVLEQSLGDRSGAQPWQVGMLNLLGENGKTEATLRAMALQANTLEPWLTLLRFQATHNRADALAATIAEIKQRVDAERPELLEAECCWAASDRPAAEKAFNEAVNRYPDVRDVQMLAAQFYQEIGRYDLAEACLKRALDRDPTFRPAARMLAIVMTAQPGRAKDWEQAIALLGPENLATDTPEDRLTRGIVLARSGDPNRAKKALESLQELVADVTAENAVASAARDMIARLLLAAGQTEQATKMAEVAANKDFNSTTVAFYAELLLRTKQLDAAEEQLKRLDTIEPGNIYAANIRARLTQARAQPDEAANALEKAYIAGETKPGAEAFGREAFALIRDMGPNSYPIAERLGRRLAEHNPALSWMPAQILALLGDRDEALVLCGKSVEAGNKIENIRESCQIALAVAVTYRSQASALKEADDILERARKAAPGSDDLIVMHAMIQHLQGHYDEEVRFYRQVLAHQPRNPVVLNNLAWALSEGEHQPSEALETIDALISFTGRDPETLDTRGVIMTRLGRFDEAITDLEEAASIDPSGLRHYHLASAYRKAGREAACRKAFAMALRAGLTSSSIDPTEQAEFETMKSSSR